MYPDEFVQLLRKHKAPRWHTIGVTSSQVTNWQRQKDTPFDQSGTVYVGGLDGYRDLFVVPCNCLPYTSIKTATWSEERARWENGIITRGWRTALNMLVKGTYLYPSPELSWLIGQDTFDLYPKEFRR